MIKTEADTYITMIDGITMIDHIRKFKGWVLLRTHLNSEQMIYQVNLGQNKHCITWNLLWAQYCDTVWPI